MALNCKAISEKENKSLQLENSFQCILFMKGYPPDVL